MRDVCSWGPHQDTCTHMCIHTCLHAHVHRHTDTNTCTHTYTQTCTYTRMHICTHTYSNPCAQTHAPVHTQKDAVSLHGPEQPEFPRNLKSPASPCAGPARCARHTHVMRACHTHTHGHNTHMLTGMSNAQHVRTPHTSHTRTWAHHTLAHGHVKHTPCVHTTHGHITHVTRAHHTCTRACHMCTPHTHTHAPHIHTHTGTCEVGCSNPTAWPLNCPMRPSTLLSQTGKATGASRRRGNCPSHLF